jgi:hypothetical protein
MFYYISQTTFILSTRGDNSDIDDFFDRLGPANCSMLKQVEISTNFT